MKIKREIYIEKVNKILVEIASLYDMAYESGYEKGLRKLDDGDVIERYPQEEIAEEEKDEKKAEIEPSEDCISREYMLEKAQEWKNMYLDSDTAREALTMMMNEIDNAPSVVPK